MRRALVLAVLVLLGACREPEPRAPAVARRVSTVLPAFSSPPGFTRLRFGLVPYLSAETIARAHEKMAQYLGRSLGVPVELEVGATYADVIERLEKGEFDLVELSPVAYAEASQRVPLRCLVQSISDGSATASGYIFVREDSPRRSVEELKGATFGFVDPMSTSGYLFARKVLKDKGLDVEKDLARTEFLGNHEAVLLAVLEGRVDAGATYQGSFNSLRRARGVDPLSFRVIAKTPRTPRDIFCVRADLPGEVAEAITASLLALSGRDRVGREILGPINMNGFQPADDASYAEVRALAKELAR